MPESAHCDDYIDDTAQPKCMRRSLEYNRLPAAAKYPSPDEEWNRRMEEHLC